jgi:uncharacterized protein
VIKPAPAAEAPVDDFTARTPWTPDAAVAYTLFTVVLSLGVSVVLQALSFRISRWLFDVPGTMPADHVTLANTMVTMLVIQSAMILLALWGAARGGGVRRRVLSLPPSLPLRTFLEGLGTVALLVIPFNTAMYLLWPDTFATDLRIFAAFSSSPAIWLAALVVVVGAPLSEELLFRGFLLPALAKARHGFTGAAFLSTAGWTMLHFNYSIPGLLEVFTIGLVFCWLVRRTGNLWLTICLHALYNGLQLTALALWPRALGL